MSSYPQGNSSPADGIPDYQRQRAIDRLTEAFASNRLSMDEYERRVSQANALTRIDALEELTSDLPAVRPSAEPTRGRPARDTAARVSADSPAGTNDAIVGAPAVSTMCVMGDRSLAGNWLTSDRVSTFTLMGSIKVDLRDADLPPGRVKIDVFTVMGETTIIVPPGLPVHMGASVIMGEARADRDVNQQTRGAATWVEISGMVLMGEIRVRTLA